MSKQILVIGAGVIGLCTAYYAMRKGHRVTVLDRGPATPRNGCSFGNMGMVVPSHFIPLAAPGMVALGLKWMWNPESPLYIKPRLNGDLVDWGIKFWRASTAAHVRRSAPVLRDLSLASRACFEELNELPEADFDLQKKGLLMLCKTQHSLDEEAKVAATSRELGIPADVLDARQTASLDPNIRMDVAGAVYFPKDCHLTPANFIALLERELRSGGVAFVWNAEITGWKRQGRRIEAVETSQGEFSADEYVLCGGSWSPEVVRELGLRLPMQAGKGYSLTLSNPPRLPQICSILTEARVAVTPMDSKLRIGGTMEIAGLNEEINPRRVKGIVRAVPQYFPEFTPEDFVDVQPWSGLRPCSPDGLPYVGRFEAFDNLATATGHAMMGLSLGPVTGKIMAELLSGERPEIDLTLLSPDRYA